MHQSADCCHSSCCCCCCVTRVSTMCVPALKDGQVLMRLGAVRSAVLRRRAAAAAAAGAATADQPTPVLIRREVQAVG